MIFALVTVTSLTVKRPFVRTKSSVFYIILLLDLDQVQNIIRHFTSAARELFRTCAFFSFFQSELYLEACSRLFISELISFLAGNIFFLHFQHSFIYSIQ